MILESGAEFRPNLLHDGLGFRAEQLPIVNAYYAQNGGLEKLDSFTWYDEVVKADMPVASHIDSFALTVAENSDQAIVCFGYLQLAEQFRNELPAMEIGYVQTLELGPDFETQALLLAICLAAKRKMPLRMNHENSSFTRNQLDTWRQLVNAELAQEAGDLLVVTGPGALRRHTRIKDSTVARLQEVK